MLHDFRDKRMAGLPNMASNGDLLPLLSLFTRPENLSFASAIWIFAHGGAPEFWPSLKPAPLAIGPSVREG